VPGHSLPANPAKFECFRCRQSSSLNVTAFLTHRKQLAPQTHLHISIQSFVNILLQLAIRTKRYQYQSNIGCSRDKLKFHGTDTDTDTDYLADFRARILARKSARRAARSARRQSPRTFVRRALFLARMSVGDARVYTYMINYRVHIYKITR